MSTEILVMTLFMGNLGSLTDSSRIVECVWREPPAAGLICRRGCDHLSVKLCGTHGGDVGGESDIFHTSNADAAQTDRKLGSSCHWIGKRCRCA